MNSQPKTPLQTHTGRSAAEPQKGSVAPPKHTLTVRTREHTELCGVAEVLRFDETCVVLRTDCGQLNVEGTDIRIRVLDVERGVVAFDGHVDGIWYDDDARERGEKGFFGRLFH